VGVFGGHTDFTIRAGFGISVPSGGTSRFEGTSSWLLNTSAIAAAFGGNGRTGAWSRLHGATESCAFAANWISRHAAAFDSAFF